MKTRVLLVDDEPSILRSTQILLDDLGFEVTVTTDHTRVVDLLRELRPHLLLQDVRMPGLDLDALVKRIRADPDVGKTPVLLFSASIDLPEIQEQVGATGFVEKPFKPEQVVRAIESTVGPLKA